MAHGPSSLARGDGLLRARPGALATFEVVTFDGAGNQCVRGGELLRATIAPRKGRHGECLGELRDVTDCGDGRYVVTWSAGLTGTYTIGVDVNGLPLQGSPFSIVVEGDAPSWGDPLPSNMRGGAPGKQ